jgi:hypothetical protein
MARRNATTLPEVHARRAAHGALAATGATIAFEPCADGVRPVPPGVAAPIARREDGTVTPEGAAELARRGWEARRQPNFNDSAAPWLPPAEELAPFDGARKDLLSQRRDEICTITGGVSSGVGAQLRGWTYMHAAGEYWASQFFATGDPDAFERMVRAFKAASTEDCKLRDAAVWEAQARKAANKVDPLAWLREPAPTARLEPTAPASSSGFSQAAAGQPGPSNEVSK